MIAMVVKTPLPTRAAEDKAGMFVSEDFDNRPLRETKLRVLRFDMHFITFTSFDSPFAIAAEFGDKLHKNIALLLLRYVSAIFQYYES